MPVFIAGAKHAAKHAHRQLLSDGMHEIELGVFECFLDDFDGELADLILVALYPSSGEPLAHESAVAGVIGWVELHHCEASFGLFLVHLLESNTFRRGECFDVATNRQRIVVSQD